MQTVADEIREDLKRLGIDAEYIQKSVAEWEPPYEPEKSSYIAFKSQEDLNLYKVAGAFKPNWWLTYKLEKQHAL